MQLCHDRLAAVRNAAQAISSCQACNPRDLLLLPTIDDANSSCPICQLELAQECEECSQVVLTSDSLLDHLKASQVILIIRLNCT